MTAEAVWTMKSAEMGVSGAAVTMDHVARAPRTVRRHQRTVAGIAGVMGVGGSGGRFASCSGALRRFTPMTSRQIGHCTATHIMPLSADAGVVAPMMTLDVGWCLYQR